ncbi:Spo0B domain-containing protein [Cohnella silvisoli]|uniref:Spo0B domain-containing protein n=1 Tax=Cohnella silvisoli TaxID=2873699 RepID=A0ABV1KUA2_9BACL|nr:Spo0B domain-containing protein [Cohnella silvisoli]MCD9022703.1 Spo0B domain-containing protein [Cohnella silvisoli]
MMFRKMTLTALAAILSLAIPAVTVFIWHRYWWPLILFVLWTFVVCVIVWGMERRKHREHCDRLLAHAQLSAIRTLSHHRHDWMNELQILYGYLRLNKLDKAVDVVDRIRVRMDHDSKLSQIGIPELASFLLSFRTVCDTMRLDVDMQDGLHLDRLPYEAEKLSRAVIGLVNVFRFRAVSSISGENVLKLKLSCAEGGLKIVMAYEGELAAADSVIVELEKCLEGIGLLDQVDEPAEKTRQARTMVIHFPLPA